MSEKLTTFSVDDISLCPSCNCMSRTITRGVAWPRCGKCNAPKETRWEVDLWLHGLRPRVGRRFNGGEYYAA